MKCTFSFRFAVNCTGCILVSAVLCGCNLVEYELEQNKNYVLFKLCLFNHNFEKDTQSVIRDSCNFLS